MKAKSYKKDETSFFKKEKDGLDSRWEPYIADIAFQTFVAKKAFPEYTFTSALMLADKSVSATVDGLHQKFLLKNINGRSVIDVPPDLKLNDLGAKILKIIPTDIEVQFFLNQLYDGKNFESYVSELAALCQDRKWISPRITRSCGSCEFRVARQDLAGKNSGFENCWKAATSIKSEDFEKPLLFDIWALDFRIKDRLLSEAKYFLTDVQFDDLSSTNKLKAKLKTISKKTNGLTRIERQWKQIELYSAKSKSSYFNAEDFLTVASHWKYPLHFIDFETITSAIPFTKGLNPYETISFQFSHHDIEQSGKITHRHQFLSSQPGEFPNFEFLRSLKKALDQDQGTIFRYATHENTVLRHVKRQLEKSSEVDRHELIEFIDQLTVEKSPTGKIIRSGSRAMVDMLELVKNYYLSPLMGGSNSIKSVLPAILQESEFLKNKYSKPIYGHSDGIISHNFKNKIWWQIENGKMIDPYKTLEPVFRDLDPTVLSVIDRITDFEEIREGGSASMAYARMQLTQMGADERGYIANALLKYCELDTLAMVMIYEYWIDLANKTPHSKK